MQIDHEWQRLGYKPPFKLVGFFAMPSKSLAEANPSAYQNAMNEMPRGCGIGSCGVCGMSLINNFIIQDAAGTRFAVGCDCVEKHGDSKLISSVEAHKKRLAKEKRAAKANAKRQEKYAQYEAAMEQQRITNGGLTDYELELQALSRAAAVRLEAVLELVSPIAKILNRQKGDFCRSIVDTFTDGNVGSLSPRAISIVDDICKKNGMNDAALRIQQAVAL